MQPTTATDHRRAPTGPTLCQHDLVKLAADRKPELAALVRSLVTECADPAHLLELYYWSREPDLTSVMRAFIALPDETQTTLQAFLAAAPDPRSVSVTMHRSDRITLSRPQAAR